jgi:transposase
MGWYREARVKSMESRCIRALLIARAKLVDLKRDIENQMRGLLKSLGTVLGKVAGRPFLGKVVAVLRQAPHLRPIIQPMMSIHSALVAQILTYDEHVRALAKNIPTVRRLMTVPGVGPVTAWRSLAPLMIPSGFPPLMMSAPISDSRHADTSPGRSIAPDGSPSMAID